MNLLSETSTFKLARAVATMRLIAGELRRREPARACALDTEADGLASILHDDRERQDLEDAHRECQYHEWLESQARFTDADLMAAGLPPG